MKDKSEEKQSNNHLSFSINAILGKDHSRIESQSTSHQIPSGTKTCVASEACDSGFSSSPELQQAKCMDYFSSPCHPNPMNLWSGGSYTAMPKYMQWNPYVQYFWSGGIMPTPSPINHYPVMSEQLPIVSSSTNNGGFSLSKDLLSNSQEIDKSESHASNNKPREKRFRTTFTPDQLVILEKEFAKDRYLVGAARKKFAKSLDLSDAQVKVWFQNRRIKWKQENERAQTADVPDAADESKNAGDE